MLGILQLRTGEPAASESLLTQAMAVYPDRFTFVFNRGIARFHMKRFAEAAQDFEQAITLEERPEAWLNLGLARHALGEREAAIRAFSRCSELAPEGERPARAGRPTPRRG